MGRPAQACSRGVTCPSSSQRRYSPRMVVCPVCEHAQAGGLECDVCGKDLGDLGELGPPPVASIQMEDLETTVPPRVGDVPVERVAALELTSFRDTPVPAVDPMPDFETGRAPPVDAVAASTMAELADERARDEQPQTAPSSEAVTCRYCRNVQSTGVLCDVCGMKLPRVGVPFIAAPVGQAVRCRACGAPATSGQRCSECGVQQPEA
jgi:hypothetical protein